MYINYSCVDFLYTSMYDRYTDVHHNITECNTSVY